MSNDEEATAALWVESNRLLSEASASYEALSPEYKMVTLQFFLGWAEQPDLIFQTVNDAAHAFVAMVGEDMEGYTRMGVLMTLSGRMTEHSNN